ncbi:MAG TPA: hypothetical protein VK675_04045, partial [Candidatus Paceibacterota bacterium]|nr:hypothetical protein [Candidatus Paceibacterota bacterium]
PPSQATTTAPVMVQPVETFRTLDIPAQGLPVYLRQGWKSFPIGGSIIIVNPSGRRIEDKPGEMRDWGFQPDGIYTFHADPPGSSRKVRIYNRW